MIFIKKINPLILCKCGICGKKRHKYDKKGRKRKYVIGHQHFGKKFTKKHCKKISLAKKGKPSNSPTKFKKGQNPWNKGLIGKQIAWNKGLTKNTDKRVKYAGLKISNKLKHLYKNKKNHPRFGKKHTKQTKKIISIKKKGKRCSPRTEFKKGEKHIFFNNWSSREPYGIKFSPDLKKHIKKKYNYRCQQCFRHQNELFDKNKKRKKLAIHHIDFDKKNNSENNLIPLCNNCHAQTNYNRDAWIIYFKTKVNNT